MREKTSSPAFLFGFLCNGGVEDGVVKALLGSSLLAVEIEEDDFVAARLEERRG
jgi:hypothetical protein